MRNDERFKIRKIIFYVRNLPYFTLDTLSGIENNNAYLKILFSRYIKSGKIIRLKKGLYVCKDYINELEKEGKISTYSEFIDSILYETLQYPRRVVRNPGQAAALGILMNPTLLQT